MTKRIFIDATSYVKSKTTGIQRVVKSFTSALVNHDDYQVYILNETKHYGKYSSKLLSATDNFAQIDCHNLLFDSSISIDDLGTNDIWLDIDSVWNNYFSRTSLYNTLSQNNVKISALIHDLLPLKFPQYFYEDTLINFMKFITAVVAYKVHIFTLTNHVHKSVKEIFENEIENICTIGFGDLQKEEADKNVDFDFETNLFGEYILCVGTIEPRKNYKYIINSFQKIIEETNLNLVIIGKSGWNCDKLLKIIDEHPYINKRIFYLSHVTDHILHNLYANAWACAQASIDEGLGLPIVEALQYNKIVFCSDIDVFKEIGESYCFYFNIHAPRTFSDKVIELYKDDSLKNCQLEHIKSFKIQSWDDPVQRYLNALYPPPKTVVSQPTQAVLLTADSTKAIETLNNFEKHLQFLDEFLILCPRRTKLDIQKKYHGSLSLDFITDEELISPEELADITDHAKRNFILRCRSLKNSKLHDTFIATDDDYRALKSVNIDTFIEDEKYVAYYFNKMESWRGSPSYTSYDFAIKNTYSLLTSYSMPTYQFSSHMPQIINKDIFQDAVDFFSRNQDLSYSEWEIYFNFAIHNHRDSFTLQIYKSIFWPFCPSDFEMAYLPTEALFENYYDITNFSHSEDTYISKLASEISQAENPAGKITFFKEMFYPIFYLNHARKNFEKEFNEANRGCTDFCLRFFNGKFVFSAPSTLFFFSKTLNKYSLITNTDAIHFISTFNVFYVFRSESDIFSCTCDINLYEKSNLYELNIYPPQAPGKYGLEILISHGQVMLAQQQIQAIVTTPFKE